MKNSEKIQYNRDLLNFCKERDKPQSVDDIPDKLNRDAKINFICICGKSGEAFFQSIYKYGFKCKICKYKVAYERRKKTNLQIYGVEKISHSKEIQEKTKQTNLKRYGVENPSQSKEILEKIKQTNLKIRGVPYPSQDPNVQEKAKQTNLKKYGVKCTLQNEEVRKKVKQTNLERRGVENSMQDPNVREKAKQTNLKRYGVEYTFQNKEIQEKTKKTNLLRYGVEIVSQNKEIQAKVKKTNLKLYGVVCTLQSEEVKEKTRKTKIQKYGVPHHSQNQEMAEKILKSSYRKKTYIFPNGRTDIVQGYEPYALDILIKKYSYDDIITGPANVPEIWYELEDKKKRYFTDIFILSEKLCIEVKSIYTYNSNIEKNNAKKKGAINSGYNFVFWIFDRNGKFIEEKI